VPRNETNKLADGELGEGASIFVAHLYEIRGVSKKATNKAPRDSVTLRRQDPQVGSYWTTIPIYNRHVYQRPSDGKADMQISFLSDKWWPCTCWPCNPCWVPVEHEPAEGFPVSLSSPLRCQTSPACSDFSCAALRQTLYVLGLRIPPPRPLPPPSIPSISPRFPITFLAVFTSLFSVTFLGSTKSAVASGWLPGLCIIVFADHFRCLSSPSAFPALFIFFCCNKTPTRVCTT
ncbi:hypothetical protein INR49_026603, partial [Caranx melampygus]